jgi:hypothetical protein
MIVEQCVGLTVPLRIFARGIAGYRLDGRHSGLPLLGT